MVGITLLIDVSPSSRKMHGKRSIVTHSFNQHILPPNSKKQKLDIHILPKTYDSFVNGCPSSNIKHQNRNPFSDNRNSFKSGINHDEIIWYNNKNINKENRNSCKDVAHLAPLPLRSIPVIEEMLDHEKSAQVKGHSYGNEKISSDKIEEKVGFLDDDAWNHKFNELGTESRELLTSLVPKNLHFESGVSYKGKYIVGPKKSMEAGTSTQERGFKNVSVELEGERKYSRSLSPCEETEDEVCIISAAEWHEKLKCNTSDGVLDSKAIERRSWHEVEPEKESELHRCMDNDLAITEMFSVGVELLPDIEGKFTLHERRLINLNKNHDGSHAFKVREALQVFEKSYTEFLHRYRGEGSHSKARLEAANCVKAKELCMKLEKPFGHIPGIEIGDQFPFRDVLKFLGLHRQSVCGIDYVLLNGKKYATSVVNSGRYENDAKRGDILIYSGEGGNPSVCSNKSKDQKLEKGNLALKNSMEKGYPVRVIYKMKTDMHTNKSCVATTRYVYVYDGLYIVNDLSQDRDQNGKLVYKFELHKMSGQSKPRRKISHSRATRKEVCMLGDLSIGKENVNIRVLNGIDNDRPSPVVYRTKMVYPDWLRLNEPVGCDCVGGCLDSKKCPCVTRNRGEIPFNEKGLLLKGKPFIYECGPSCKCPPSCMNRVSQNGPKHKLEIFKTKKRGWGVKSRDFIISGAFICEYVGEILQDKEAEERNGNDEYLFDIGDGYDEVGDGFAIDAKKIGNIGRFINHSCDPNIFAQRVFYDHDDKRMPHIMFFAGKNIRPLQELTYDYNYKLGRVLDVNGKERTMACHCGSRDCSGRLY